MEEQIKKMLDGLAPEIAKKMFSADVAMKSSADILPVLKHLYVQLGALIEKLESRSDTCTDSSERGIEGDSGKEPEGDK
jgi:hypothetical protein